jgi:hypothetical protein
LGVDGLLDVLLNEQKYSSDIFREKLLLIFIMKWFISIFIEISGCWIWMIFISSLWTKQINNGLKKKMTSLNYFSLLSLLQLRFERNRAGLGVPPSLDS